MEVKAVDVGYGNVKICSGVIDGKLESFHFPSIAKQFTGINRGTSALSKKDLIEVMVGNSRYLVGKDSMDTLSSRDDKSGHLKENYIETAKHMALLRGALHYMDEDNIDLLVSGLPVNNFNYDKEKMKELLIGEHHYPDGRVITVKDAWVIPQPVGGFVDYFINVCEKDRVDNIKSLTLDVGYFTLDWLTCRGLKIQEERSGSTPGGMSLILSRLTELISDERGSPFKDISIIDAGIQNGFKTNIQGKEYSFSHLIPQMDDFISTAIESVLGSVGSLDDIDVILLVGGGAKCYQRIVKKMLNNRDIIVPDNSIYSNVNGFYWAGTKKAAEK